MHRLCRFSDDSRRRALRALGVILPGLALLSLVPAGAPLHAAEANALEIRHGDHVALVGNTLADRMQHDGWLEAYLHSRFPKHELTIRNLGFSGDELTLRLRSANFGSPERWLTTT